MRQSEKHIDQSQPIIIIIGTNYQKSLMQDPTPIIG